MDSPRFVWCNSHGLGRNIFVLFRRSFRLANVPQKALVHLFADSRYRLRVNGEVLAYGPVRFSPSHPEYDSVDIAAYLRKGANCITVEANAKGASSFDTRPSIGGFIAWGQIGPSGKKESVSLSTPGEWKSRQVDAWDGWTPPFSFAQGPIESLDPRQLPEAWFSPDASDEDWPDAVEIENQKHWGEPSARSIPMLNMTSRLPERVLLAARIDGSEQRIGVRVAAEGTNAKGERQRVCYATCLYSPREQEITIGAFWGPHYLNGEALGKGRKSATQGNREDFTARLRAGWNLLYGEPETLHAAWPILIGLPAEKGIIASATEDQDCPDVMQYTLPVDKEELEAARRVPPRSVSELPKLSQGWQRVKRGECPGSPAREAGWDLPVEKLNVGAHQIRDIALPAGDSMLVFDFGGEFLGHAQLEVDAPEGTVIDVANGESPRENGTLDIFKTHWAVNSADRFVLRGGTEQIEAFHARGGRYLQISVRNASAPVTLKRVAIRETTYPLDVGGSFECGDPVFNWMWQTGLSTLRACMEDAYLDCPWRERGCYLGDMLAEYHVTRAVSSDPALVRRCLRFFAQCQHADGQFPGMAPSCLDSPLGDYSMIWGILLRDYWAATGDIETARELYPHLQRMLSSSRWIRAESGLLNVDAIGGFIDWSSVKESKQGESAAMNAFYYRALCCGAELATALRRRDDAAKYRREAEKLHTAFQTLWDGERGCFATTRKDGKLVCEGSLHGNVLALTYGLYTDENLAALKRHVAEKVAANHKDTPGHIEPYFLHYALAGLYDHGCALEAETVMRNNYGLMKEGGAWTIWEGMTNYGSACHAWSCAGMHYFAERTLGVRQIKPGDPDEVLIAPDSATLTWAKGTVPHARGPIEVSWRMMGGRLRLEARLPKGVKARVKPAGAL
ncbi:MAG TPA: family 78 glycoside hydrolase catalytic domain, partial [Planctomycetota bacterium]|nr:family 78 glycoside hydrolase catalytic domain [Planctomycetota bacterium]